MRKIFNLECVRVYVIPIVICYLLSFLDALCQQSPDKLSFGGWAGVFLRPFISGLFLAFFLLIAGRFAKWIFIVVFPIILAVVFIQFFVRLSFGWNFAGDWLMMFKATSSRETSLFLQDNAIPLLLTLIAYLLVSTFFVYVLYHLRFPKNRWRVRTFIATLLLIPFVLAELLPHYLGSYTYRSTMCYKVITDTMACSRIYTDLGEVVAHPELPPVVGTSVTCSELPVCVFLIGESMTRNNMQIYGYERATTPDLEKIKDELCIFSDVVGVWNQTPMAVRYLFTGASFEDQVHSHYTFSEICKRAGYRTSYYSRQGRFGKFNSIVTYVFAACDPKVYLSEVMPEPIYDIDLLPYFEKQLHETTEPQVIFLHLYGCHFPYELFTPPNDKVFKSQNKLMDDYDAAVRHDDRLIGKIIENLRALKRPSVLFYVSDHGESPRSKSWRDISSPDMWELPVVVWFSEEYRKKFPLTVARLEAAKDLPLQSDLLLPGILDVVQISDTSLPIEIKGRNRRFTHMWTKEYTR